MCASTWIRLACEPGAETHCAEEHQDLEVSSPSEWRASCAGRREHAPSRASRRRGHSHPAAPGSFLRGSGTEGDLGTGSGRAVRGRSRRRRACQFAVRTKEGLCGVAHRLVEIGNVTLQEALSSRIELTGHDDLRASAELARGFVGRWQRHVRGGRGDAEPSCDPAEGSER